MSTVFVVTPSGVRCSAHLAKQKRLTASLRTLVAFGVQALACLLLVTTATHAQQFANLTYPARGNFQLDEGTVELWVVSGFDSTDKTASATFFNLIFPGEHWHYIIFHIGWAQRIAMVGYTHPQQSYVWAGPMQWRPGEAHHIAWTWRGRQRSMYLDGKSHADQPHEAPIQGEGREKTTLDVTVEGWLHGDLTAAQLCIGRGSSRFTLDELRVSSIARTPEEIARQAAAAPEADAYTLLLDHCDGETIGALTGAYEFVPTKFGKGIKLWKE